MCNLFRMASSTLVLMSVSHISWRRQWHPTPVLLPGKSHGWRNLVGCQTRLSEFAFTFHFHALEKEMATHSSALAWRIPGMGQPGWLPSMGSHRVGHDLSDLAAAAHISILHSFLWMNNGMLFVHTTVCLSIDLSCFCL